MTARQEWRRGWRVVLGSSLGLGTGFTGYHYTATLFIPELTREFGWTRGDIAGAMAAALVGSLFTPFAGRLVDRVGVRIVIGIATLLVGCGYVALALQPGSLAVFAVIIALTATAGLAGGALSYTRAVAGWFRAGRGLALGLTIGGVSIAAIIMPPLIALAMDAYGWRAGYLLLGAVAVGVGLPAMLLFVRERRDVVAPGAEAVVEPGLEWRDAMRTRAFVLLVLAVLLVHAAGSGAVQQLAPLLGDKGFSKAAIPLYVSALGASVLSGRLLLGWLLDRMPATVIGAVACAMPAIGCLIFLQPQVSSSAALVAIVAIGFSQGAELDLMAYIVARWFGMRSYGTVFGALIATIAAAGAVGVALFGKSFDATGSYDLPLTLAMIAAPLGALFVLAIGRPPLEGEFARGWATPRKGVVA